MRISSKAPCRVDLAGGTLDIWPLYVFHPGSVTVNFAINLYARCILEQREDRQVEFQSIDLGVAESFPSLGAVRGRRRTRLPLHEHLLRFFSPEGGLRVETDCQAPAGAGLAGSSTLIIAVARALARLTGANYAQERLREIAQNIEAQIIGVPTGCQDYYPALYGGVNAIELGVDAIRRTPIPVDAEELNERLVLAYTGAPRQSGINNWEVMKAHIDGDARVHRNFEQIAAIARAMRAALEKADWTEAGRLLRQEWAHRRRNAPGIATPLIDSLVAGTRRAGAIGAKACGAGGGGCVVFLVERGAKARVAAVVESLGAAVLPVQVEPRGAQLRVVAE